MSSTKKNDGFLIQGSIYAISALASQVIGLIYRIPMAKILGDEGNGYYASAFNIYAYILLLSSYSLPLAISKMISERLGRGDYQNADRIFKASIVYATIVGGIGCAVMFFGASWFANIFIHIPLSIYALTALAPTVWIVAYLGVVRGYFQGRGTMVPTSWSQVIEQIINAIMSIVAAILLMRIAVGFGLDTSVQRAYGAMGGTIGTGLGALSALIFLIICIAKYNTKYKKENVGCDAAIDGYGKITVLIIRTVIPVILSSAIYNLTGILDNAIFARSGSNSVAIAADYGIYTGKYKILINVPISIANALSSTLVPVLSKDFAAKKIESVHRNISLAIRYALFLALPSCIGLSILARPIITLLFGYSEKAVLLLHIGSATIIFYCISTLSNAILQGISHMRLPVKHACISLVCHTIFLYILLYVLELGIVAVVLVDMLFALCMCLLNALALKRLIGYRQEIGKTLVKPAISAMIMGVFTYASYQILLYLGTSVIVQTVVPVIISIVVYFNIAIFIGAITEDELLGFPKGKLLVRMARKIHILKR